LDIIVVDDKSAFACGEFGLKEYVFDGEGGIEDQYFIIEN
jgi:hypothetical protein